MAPYIKNPEAERLARELAARMGETITETVVKALSERLRRETAGTGAALPGRALKDEIMAISRRAGALPRRRGKTADEIVGYDARGLPR